MKRRKAEDGIRVYDSHYRGPCNTERGEHISCMSWLELHYPERWPLIFHAANETKGTAQHMVMRRRMGVKPGVSDIIDIGGPVGAFELKRQDRTRSSVSAAQRDFLTANALAGGFSAVCYGYECFRLAFIDYVSYCDAYLNQTEGNNNGN